MPLSLGQALLTRASSLLAREAARVSNAGSQPLPPMSALSAEPPGSSGLDGIAAQLLRLDATELQRQTLVLLRAVFHALAEGRSAREPSWSVETGHVPLIACAAAVDAGTEAVATLRIANEEQVEADVSLYTSNFIADSGYEIPSIVAHVTPRKASIVPGGETTFEVRIGVPSQTPAGMYSGLVQATNSRYVKAVVVFDVV